MGGIPVDGAFAIWMESHEFYSTLWKKAFHQTSSSHITFSMHTYPRQSFKAKFQPYTEDRMLEMYLISSGGTFEFGFFSLENSKNRYVGTWYKKIPVRTVVCVAKRDNPLTERSGVLRVVKPGILALLNGTGTIIWSTNTSTAVQTPVAQLLDSGNLVVKDANDDDPENFG
ncbi:hypothetical protein ACS0TY_017057 [Phlomoides rotata]